MTVLPSQIALLFLKLGTIAFGGPAAHIALIEAEVVRRRRWLSREEFLDLLGATNLIPGPNSTEIAIHVGLRKAGWKGFFAAGCCFILPAAVIVTVFAWLYVRYGSTPQVDSILYGVKPVMIAIVIQALWSLGRTALNTPALVVLAAASAAISFLGVHELVILFSAALVFGTGRAASQAGKRGHYLLSIGPAIGLAPIFLFFVKIGSVLFGSGYVLLAFLRADLVERWQWLTEAQLLDAIAVGQATPGPLFTTATFIGYLLGGIPGAVAATVGIFLPAFFFVAASGPLIPRIRKSPTAAAFLDGLNAASLALMAAVTYQLGYAAVVDGATAALAAAGVILLFVFRLSSTWLVLLGALTGWIVS